MTITKMLQAMCVARIEREREREGGARGDHTKVNNSIAAPVYGILMPLAKIAFLAVVSAAD